MKELALVPSFAAPRRNAVRARPSPGTSTRSWFEDPAGRSKAGVAEDIEFEMQLELALARLDRARAFQKGVERAQERETM